MLVIALAACGPTLARAPAPTTVVRDDTQARAYDRAVSNGDARWARRGERAELEAAVASWETALALDSTDWRTAAKVSRALHLLGDGWIAFEADRGALVDTLERGMHHAETGMSAASPAFARAIARGTAIEQAVTELDAAQVELVYWYATNLGSWMHVQGRLAGMKYRGRLEALMRWVHANDRAYFFHGADRFLGAYLAALPGVMGGSLDASERHFLAARDGAPEFPGTYLLMAEYLAPGRDDPEMFDRHVNAVMTLAPCAPGGRRPCIVPGFEPEMAVEQKKARALAARKASLF